MMILLKRLVAMLCLYLAVTTVSAQQVDLFKMQDSANVADNKVQGPEKVVNTFYSTRLVNSQTVEILGPGSMDFRINHRFGPVNSGAYNFFGLDAASMRLGFDFGLTKDLMVGIGRTTFNKEFDGFAKYRILHQTAGTDKIPLSIALVAALAYKTLDMDPTLKVTGADRTFFTGQVLIARKLTEHTSIQVSPTYTHYNRLINQTGGSLDMFSAGFLIRQKISKRISINAEYFYQINRFNNTYDALSFGVDINTGGHVFQLHFTNSTGMNEHTFIHETNGSWGDGSIRFGFNISRIFNIARRR